MTQYEKLNFVNGSPPALNAATLNHIEDGIVAATEGVTAVEKTVEDNKAETDTALAKKAEKDSVYTKTEVDTKLSGKADKSTTLAGYGITDAYTKTEVDTSIDNSTSDLKNVINPQIATATATTTEGTAIMIRVTSGKWLKNSIIRLSIEADDTVINGKVTFGVTYGSENLSNIAVPYVNTQAIYRL